MAEKKYYTREEVEEIEDIIESEKDFKETGISYNFEEVKKLARKELINLK